MCGIAGIVSKSKVKKESVKKMTDVIAHRGPDGEGQWINKDEYIILEHKRFRVGPAQPTTGPNFTMNTFNVCPTFNFNMSKHFKNHKVKYSDANVVQDAKINALSIWATFVNYDGSTIAPGSASTSTGYFDVCFFNNIEYEDA